MVLECLRVSFHAAAPSSPFLFNKKNQNKEGLFAMHKLEQRSFEYTDQKVVLSVQVDV